MKAIRVARLAVGIGFLPSIALAQPSPSDGPPAALDATSASDESAASGDGADQDIAIEEPSRCDGPFCQGNVGLSILLGSATVGDSNYLILGGGVSYFVLDGLSLGLDADVWLLEKPTVYTTTPQARYILHFVPVLKPYVGAFYRHYFLSGGYDDLNSVGGRVGAYFVMDSGSYIGLGAIYEKFLGCDSGEFRDCDGWYPELSFGFSF